jgi:glycosyltransferase involved in cell wall biosynthesis
MTVVQQYKAGSITFSNQHNGQDPRTPPIFSIVVPAYCEECNLPVLYEELLSVLNMAAASWEILIVDDGSTDATWRQICALHRRDTRVKGLRLSRNFGHQYALFAGLANTTGQAVITMDADLQHPPAVIPQLLAHWYEGSKIVHTVRIDHQNISWFKRITSWLFYRIFSYLSGVNLSAGMADFRLMDRQVVDEILQLGEGGLFLRGLVHWVGYPSSHLEFRSRNRYSGQPKYNLRKMLQFGWAGITSFSLVPLRTAILVGVVTSLFSFGGILYALWGKFYDRAVPGWASETAIISFMFGTLFIMLGIIGEYIGRILEEVRRRPRFLVQERVGLLGFDSNSMPISDVIRQTVGVREKTNP